jgi:hypothetical protein
MVIRALATTRALLYLQYWTGRKSNIRATVDGFFTPIVRNGWFCLEL